VQDALISSDGKKTQIQEKIGCHNNTGSNKNLLKNTPKQRNKPHLKGIQASDWCKCIQRPTNYPKSQPGKN